MNIGSFKKNICKKNCLEHIIISGTGRAGTTFLVQYLTAVGLNTGFSIEEAVNNADHISHAGLETNLLDINNPALYYKST